LPAGVLLLQARRSEVSISDDRIELFGSEKQKMVAYLRATGGGRAVQVQSGAWEYRNDIPPNARLVVDVDAKGRVTESNPD
jgi:hypothetical protein